VIVTEGSGAGAFTTFPTGCGGLGFGPTGGLPVIGSTVGWQVTGNTGTPAILVGFVPINFPICPACILGATIDVVVNGATIPASPIPCDPLLIGGQVYLQGIDIGSAGGCVTPLPLRMSNTVRITIG
jgi:hypothetical protein